MPLAAIVEQLIVIGGLLVNVQALMRAAGDYAIADVARKQLTPIVTMYVRRELLRCARQLVVLVAVMFTVYRPIPADSRLLVWALLLISIVTSCESLIEWRERLALDAAPDSAIQDREPSC